MTGIPAFGGILSEPWNPALFERLAHSPDREELPNGRPSLCAKIYFPWRPADGEAIGALGRRVYVRAGFCVKRGMVREIFARGGSKVGEDIDTGLDNISMALSCLLQIGIPLDVLAESAPPRLAHYLVAPDRAIARQYAAHIAIQAVIHAAIQLEAAVSAGEFVLTEVGK